MRPVGLGDTFWSLHPDHLSTPHLFLVVSDRTLHRFCVAAMITDIRNVHPPVVTLEMGTEVTKRFRLRKPSTIHPASAYFLAWELADDLVRRSLFTQHEPGTNPELVTLGRYVMDYSDEWEPALLQYTGDVDWNAPDG